MPNPLSTTDAPDIQERGTKFLIKNMHLGKYTKKELAMLKKKNIKPGTKQAHVALGKKKKMMTDGGYMYA